MECPAEVMERLRVERGLSQADACALSGLPQATWRNVESGVTANPQPETRIRIARALGVTPSTIWRPRPRPLHLEDVDDPRWEAAVRRMAQRLDRDGSLEERQRFGRRLIAVLDYADPGSREAGMDETRWEELWRLGNSLSFDPEKTPIAIINGKLVERDLDCFTPATRMRVIAAKRNRLCGIGAIAGHPAAARWSA
jgi:transcriptional regulator with XRE-family HTH domain